MQSFDAIIVGGGPAGASCAWKLKQHGIKSVILESAEFPRTKLCAGWITPEVVADTQLDIGTYPHRFLTFEQLHIHMRGLHFKLNSVQHSIRRYEFDDWLLKRSGVPVVTHTVKDIVRQNGMYVVDGEYAAPSIVGAGGTRCPVYRTFFRSVNPRAKELQTATLEQEFPYDYDDPNCHLWFFERGFPGYAWYVPKADGYVNVGIGGMAVQLKSRGEDIKDHWAALTDTLRRKGLVTGHVYEPKGYSYFLRADVETVKVDQAYIVGDAAGLATRDMCEGIGPAIRSGLLAADSIAHGTAYSLADIGRHSIEKPWIHRLLEYMFVTRGRKLATPSRFKERAA